MVRGKLSRVLGVVLLAGLGLVPVAASGQTHSSRRVRSGDPSVAAALVEGARRSATFRALVERIDRSDGMVYIEPGGCSKKGVKACLLAHVHEVGGLRYLRIHVPAHNRPSGDLLIALIGHELQHARELLDVKWARTTTSVCFLFRSTGNSTSIRSYETEAAQRAGDAIARELAVTAVALP